MATQKVRILVAINADRAWEALGSSQYDERKALDELQCITVELADPILFHWIEAELPVPEIAGSIQGHVRPFGENG